MKSNTCIRHVTLLLTTLYLMVVVKKKPTLKILFFKSITIFAKSIYIYIALKLQLIHLFSSYYN